MPEKPSITISRTIYDPATKGFITSTLDAKALPNIKEWINQHNPAIYWYVLRIDNPTDADISQWAVRLYAHQALTITEAYVDGSDRKFELKKREHDDWNEKYVLSIPRQIGIPVVGKGTRRIFFKVDIDCKEGLMHEYGISGHFIAQGTNPIEIKEKMFQYSCKVGEFRQIFDKDPDEASHYAEKRLVSKYSSNSVQIFTNSFRMIHELYGYCHSNSLNRDDLLQKLHLLHTSFESVPEIAGKRISPLIHKGIRELDVIVDRAKFAPRFMKLCDALVELLHIEVMGAEVKDAGAYVPSAEPENVNNAAANFVNGQNDKCLTCGNIIDSSNKSLICKECKARFCTTCEEWYREERQRGQKPLCENCFDAEQKRLKTEQDNKAQEESKRKKQEEEAVRIREEKKRHDKLAKEGNSIGMKFTHIPAGEFMMRLDEYDPEKPVHKVNISKSFDLGTYPVTQREWKAVMGDNPSNFKGDDLPVEQVSWNDVQEFIKKLNKKEGADKYRLPSEAEWEYACRAGTTTRYSFGDDEGKLGDYAWYAENSGSRPPNKGDFLGYDKDDWFSNKWNGNTHPVGQKKPNPWGLYDMHGNVYEWVQDWYHDDYEGAPTDGSAWESESGSDRVDRGGSWYLDARNCRSANRVSLVPVYRSNYLGFRLLRGQ